MQAAFTFTTTHHAELKDEAERNANFVSAAVQFNVETLKPTYQLVWGELGASNALAVAQTLGFDRTIVSAGKEWKHKLAHLQHAHTSKGQMSAAIEVGCWPCTVDDAVKVHTAVLGGLGSPWLPRPSHGSTCTGASRGSRARCDGCAS